MSSWTSMTTSNSDSDQPSYLRLLANNVTNTNTNNDDDATAAAKTALDYVSVIMSNLLLFFLIFGLSATVDVANLKRQMRNKTAIGAGVGMQFIIMPLLGFIAVISFDQYGLTKAMGLTLLVVTSSPGGSYSNWWCSTFNADLSLSVCMTSISSLLSVAMLPANLFLYTYLSYGVILDTNNNLDQEHSSRVVGALDFKSIFITLGVVMASIVSGLYAGYRYDTPAFHIYANRFGTVCGILLVVFSVFLSSGSSGSGGSSESNSNFWSHPPAFYMATALPCLVGMVAANLLARTCFRLTQPECVTIAIECCYQNVGIATSVAVTMFQDPVERSQAVSVPLFYGIVEAVAIGFYCLWAWKAGWTKAPPNENLCVVITKTYEVSVDNHDTSTINDQQSSAAIVDKAGMIDKTASGSDLTKSTTCTTSSDKDKELETGNRCRIVSEDNTASTCSTSVSFVPSSSGNTTTNNKKSRWNTRSSSSRKRDRNNDNDQGVPTTVLATDTVVPASNTTNHNQNLDRKSSFKFVPANDSLYLHSIEEGETKGSKSSFKLAAANDSLYLQSIEEGETKGSKSGDSSSLAEE